MEKKMGLFHLVQMSPWPLYSSIGFLNVMTSFVSWFNGYGITPTFFSLLLLILLSEVWWRDVERESTLLGGHPFLVKVGLKIGMILFIVSEIMFFLSFFWSFIHGSSAADSELGGFWPPWQIFPFNPVSVPLVNTVILLSSGASVTWCHHLMTNGVLKLSKFSLLLTIFLGLLFTALQGVEYISAPYCLSDSMLGSTFFVSTGFHGLHVLVGTSFLSVVYLKLDLLFNTDSQNIGFECSAWYWHFVDVVWLFLYSLIYWWGG